MPSHYGLPTRKPPVPSQQEAVIKFAESENLSDEQTRALLNMSAEQQRAFIAMSQEGTQDLTKEDLRRIMNPTKMAKGGFPDHNKDNKMTQADVLMARGAIPKPKKAAYGGLMKAKKMRGGGMAGKKPRVGNMDYRKGCLLYTSPSPRD